MANQASKGPIKNRLSAADALKKLRDGNKRFLAHKAFNYPTAQERAPLGDGQAPYAAILSCADSRVSPEIMFNVALGKAHFWFTFLGTYAIYLPMHYLGFLGVPRRYFAMGTTDFIPDSAR